MTTLSAYLDLVGTRDRAIHEPKEYGKCLTEFHTALLDSAYLLNGNDSVYLFSDSTFIESSSVSLRRFLLQVRRRLFLSGIFFAAAVKPGKLGAKDVSESDLLSEKEKGAGIARIASIVKGSVFGTAAVDLYTCQSQFKGIGVWVLDDAFPDNSLVRSCYLPDTTSRRAIQLQDLKYQVDDRKPQLLDSIITSIVSARARSRKFVRFYITPLVSWIQSLPLEKLADFESDCELDDVDPLLAEIERGHIRQYLSDSVGYEQVFFALFDVVFREWATIPDEWKTRFERIFAFHRKLDKSMQFVPEWILGDASRKAFVRFVSTKRLKPAE